MMPPLLVTGMQGLGDNIHQRAIVRQFIRERPVYLQTPWPAIYHDMPELRLLPAHSHLRTQERNERRERARYFGGAVPRHCEKLHVSYKPALVRLRGSVLGAMLAQCRCDPDDYDFRLPVPETWVAQAAPIIAAAGGRSIMLYRPLVM